MENNEVLLLNNLAAVMPVLNEFLNRNDTIQFNGMELRIKNKEIIQENLYTDAVSVVIPTLVVQDDLVKETDIVLYGLNINYSEENQQELEQKYITLFNDFRDGKIDLEDNSFILGYTRQGVYEESKSLTTTILFVGIYLGLVFLIKSMAVLALQQLSEASDSIDRYKAIKKIGASDKMIKSTIFVQTFVYFSLPILLALVHSVVGIQVANNFIAMYQETNILMSSIVTALVLIVVYSGYFFATYSGYKNIVKNNI